MVIIFLLISFFVSTITKPLTTFQINDFAMVPQMMPQAYYLVNTHVNAKKNPQRLDVVLFTVPGRKKRFYTRRIIGKPNDRFKMINGKVFINNNLLDESEYLASKAKTYEQALFQDDSEIVVPQNKYIVLGDNRMNSIDSREFGFVDTKDIVGKVLFCYWNCSFEKQK